MTAEAPWPPDLPEHWEAVQMRRLVTFRNGADYKHVEVAEGGYPVYGSGGEFHRASSYLYDGASVLFGRKGTIDRPLLVSGKFWTVDTMYYTELSSIVEPRFLHYYATTMPFSYYSTSTALPSVTQGELGGHRMPLPPKEDQRSIADYLDRETARIDTLIEEQQRLIEILRERRSAVLSSSLEPTDEWVRYRIKYIGETSLGKMLDAGRAVREGDELRPYVRAADIRADGSVNLVDLNEMPFSNDEMAAFDLRAGDVLLIEGGATVGRPGFLFDTVPGIAFQKTVNRLRVGKLADPRFVYWSMLRLYESDYYATHYSSVSFVHLTGEKLREIDLLLPPLEEQRRIASRLDKQTAKIDTLIEESERLIELARERRSAVITAAVTGQIDVREAA